MRSHIPSYELICPASVREALDVLAQTDSPWKPFAGGTDLMVLLEAGKLPHRQYVNIWGLKELRGIEVTGEYVTLGALTTYAEIQEHPVLRAEFPMLCQAAQETGGIAIQNRGTLGGNIVNASPAADTPPALLAYEAELDLVSSASERRVAYSSFHLGYKQMAMRADELLRAVRLPRTSKDLFQYYRKVGTRKAQAISKVCFAALGAVREEKLSAVRIAMGSVAPVPLRCLQTERVLHNQPLTAETRQAARTTLSTEISPIDDIRSVRSYRLQVSLNLLEDFLTQLGRSPRPE